MERPGERPEKKTAREKTSLSPAIYRILKTGFSSRFFYLAVGRLKTCLKKNLLSKRTLTKMR